MLSLDTDLRLKLVFDRLIVSCDAPVRSVVNRLREIAGIEMEFFQDHLGITLYTNFKINLLIKNTPKIIAYSNAHQNETTDIMIEPSPRSTFSTQSTVWHPLTWY
jgi:hypothetical protein